MAVEDITTKLCTKCGESKPFAGFSKNIRARDGMNCHCKDCARIATAVWRANNPERARASENAYRAANIDKVKARYVAHYKANYDKKKANVLRWQAEHPESVRMYRATARARRRAAEAGGSLSTGLAEKLFKLQRGKCACGCKQPLGDDYHLDHIMPLARGGSNTDDNIQLLRSRCNRQKQAKHPIDFMQQRGFLI